MSSLGFSLTFRAPRLLSLLLLLGTALVSACAPQVSPELQRRYLWPAAAEAAKIEYLGFYSGDQDLKRGDRVSWATEYIFGQEFGQPVFKKPFAIDARFRKVAVTDTFAHQVVVFDLDKKTIDPLKIKEGSSSKSFSLLTPTGIVFAGPDELWLADSRAKAVGRFRLDGEFLGTVGADQLTRATALAVDYNNQRVAIVDTAMHRLAVFDLGGTFLGFLGERGAGPGQFNYPLDADFDSEGDLYVLDALNSRIQRFRWVDGEYRYQSHFGERGLTKGSLQMPKSLAVSASGHVYVTDSLADKVVVFDRAGTFLLTFGGRFVVGKAGVSPGGLNMPAGIAIDEGEGIWIADTLNGMVHRYQYLNEGYLKKHPIMPGQLVNPFPGALTSEAATERVAEGTR